MFTHRWMLSSIPNAQTLLKAMYLKASFFGYSNWHKCKTSINVCARYKCGIFECDHLFFFLSSFWCVQNGSYTSGTLSIFIYLLIIFTFSIQFTYWELAIWPSNKDGPFMMGNRRIPTKKKEDPFQWSIKKMCESILSLIFENRTIQ